MTLLPAIGARGHPGKRYEVNEICAAPNCGKRSAHAHHLWSRSHLRGEPYEWVNLDGVVIGNLIGLCFGCHEKITGEIGGYRARIVFEGGLFWWETKMDDVWIRLGPLDSQPPGVKTLQSRNGKAVQPDEECPTCGHRKSKRPPGPPRKSKTWTVDVPDDAEAGADVLDEAVIWIAEELGFEDERSRLRRYHAIVAMLFWTMQRREEFVNDIAEAS